MRNPFGEKASNYRHGGNTKFKNEYNSWRAMKTRCLDPNYRRYDIYGGRGIHVCERWLDFANFLADMGQKPTKAHSIDRINSDGNYEPGNCKWSTQRQQMNNMSRNRLVTVDGITDTFSGHARRYGINVYTVHSRVRQHGWSIELALRTPSKGVGANQASYKEVMGRVPSKRTTNQHHL